MRAAQRILTALFALEATIAISAYAVIAGLLLADVASRELGAGSIWAAQRISVYLMIIVGFLGLGLAASRGRHLRPRFMDGVLPKALDATAERIGSLLMVGIFACFGVISIHYLAESIQYNDLARTIRIPLWYIQIVVPWAFFSTALRYLIFTVYPGLKPEEGLE